MVQSQFSWQQHFIHSFIDVPIHSNSILLALVPLVLALSTSLLSDLDAHGHPCLAPIPRECETSWFPLWHLTFNAAVQSWICSLVVPSSLNSLSLFDFKVKTPSSYTPPLAHFSHKLETLINSFCSWEWVCIWASSRVLAAPRVSSDLNVFFQLMSELLPLLFPQEQLRMKGCVSAELGRPLFAACSLCILLGWEQLPPKSRPSDVLWGPPLRVGGSQHNPVGPYTYLPHGVI